MSNSDSYKIYGAVLGTALMVFGLKALAGVVYHAETPEKPGFIVEVTEAGTTTEATGGETQPTVSLGTLLASADAKKGMSQVKQCGACHDFTKGGPNKVGPNLWGLVGRPHASHPDFAYSDAMKAHAGEPWTYEAINTFITKPMAAIPGTKMSFGGVKKDTDRADILAYLATLAETPPPFPAP